MNLRVRPRINRGVFCHPAVVPETLLLAAFALLDLLTTLLWVWQHQAIEGNPLMATVLTKGGIPAFVAVKCLLIVPPLGFMEWARRHRPRFVLNALRVGIAAYLVCYGIGVYHVNTMKEPIAMINWSAVERHRPRRAVTD